MGQLNEQLYVQSLSAGQFFPPAGSIANAAIAAGSAGNYVTATKLGQQRVVTLELFESTTDCAALTINIASIVGLTGVLTSFKAACITKATTDKTTTIDLKRSTGGGAFATMLSAVITKSTADTDRVFEAATLASTALVAGDILQAVVAVTAGTGGNQNKGLIVELVFTEDPQ